MDYELFEQFQENVRPGSDFDEGSDVPTLPVPLPARLIAFYLPQFHAIPENDAWWGTGFTEWTNVTKTLPWFAGHYQPRLPGALGFYDLRDPEVLAHQARIARRFGIEGFCFHYYWFGGKRLLERPLENLLADRSIDLSFCINWANENWTRRWDGRESEVLIGQSHSPEDDRAFAATVAPMFDDPRYIRVDGRPLLLLYRPRLLPDAKSTADRWREFFAKRGETPLMLMVQGFGDFDPRPFGLDGAVGFPPWGLPAQAQPLQADRVFHPSFRGDVLSYADLAEQAAHYWPEGFRFFPGVTPQWDNSARRGAQAGIFEGSTPALYAHWLEAAVRQARAKNGAGEQLVFINAWNEWAEGAYLEPDRRFGFAYLAATARALTSVANSPDMQAKPMVTSRAQHSVARPVRFGRRLARKGARLAGQLAKALSSW